MDHSKTYSEMGVDIYSELRLELDEEKRTSGIQLCLIQGNLEIFGSPMPLGIPITVTRSIGIFAVENSRLTIHGIPKSRFVIPSKASSVCSWLRHHFLFQELRMLQKCPRILVAGPKNCGKSIFVRTLCNWAFRANSQPLLVDLDTNDNFMVPPGSIACSPINNIFSIERGFLSGFKSVFFTGHTNPNRFADLFLQTCSNLFQSVAASNISADGFIINTPPYSEEDHHVLLELIQRFGVNIIVIIEDVKLSQRLQTEGMNNVLFLPKSNGVISRDPQIWKKEKFARYENYFHGSIGRSLRSTTAQFDFEQIRMFRAQTVSKSALPLGQERPRLLNPTEIDALSSDDCGSIVGVFFTLSKTSPINWQIPIAGFAHVIEVQDIKKNVTLRLPSDGIPARCILCMIVGSIKWDGN